MQGYTNPEFEILMYLYWAWVYFAVVSGE